MKNKIIEVRICHSTKYEITFVRETKDNWHTEKTYTPRYFGRLGHISFLLSNSYSQPFVQINNGAVTLHYEPKPTQQEFFDVTRVSRDDFEEKGWDASNLSDRRMREIAGYLGGNEGTMEDFWECVDFAAERFNLSRKDDRADLLRDILEEKARIKNQYEKASILSNTNPIEALELYKIARHNEDEWYMDNSYTSLIEEDEAIMPHSFYLDVVPLIKSRAAAAQQGKDYAEQEANAHYLLNWGIK
jgi:hypothetical protein